MSDQCNATSLQEPPLPGIVYYISTSLLLYLTICTYISVHFPLCTHIYISTMHLCRSSASSWCGHNHPGVATVAACNVSESDSTPFVQSMQFFPCPHYFLLPQESPPVHCLWQFGLSSKPCKCKWLHFPTCLCSAYQGRPSHHFTRNRLGLLSRSPHCCPVVDRLSSCPFWECFRSL